uniref:Uncharacterized protein n=1 Tax=viral metagenome TaxID=1070528 RepID=A0A6M3ILI2_9ZZZZ
MPVQTDLGENDGIDSVEIDDVAYVPKESEAEFADEKSDAQRIADGEIEISSREDEIFVAPDSVFNKPVTETGEDETNLAEEKKSEEKKPGAEKQKPASPAKEPDDKKYSPEVVELAKKYSQKRINKITREKYDESRAKERLEAENAELKKRLKETEMTGKKAELEKAKPDPENFQTEAAYHEALGRWSVRMELHETEAAKPEEKETEKPLGGNGRSSDDDPRKRVIELGEQTYEDFMEVVAPVPITKQMFDAVADSNYAHEVFYHLGKNPALAERIAKMKTSAAIAREIGRIESRFIEDGSEEVFVQDLSEENESENKTKKKAAASSAPKPIKPVGGGGKSTKRLDEMTLQEYYESRGYTRDGMKKSWLPNKT